MGTFECVLALVHMSAVLVVSLPVMLLMNGMLTEPGILEQ